VSTTAKTPHEDLHSELGARPEDRPDRAKNPVIKVEDLAWLEFEKPDLNAAERFAHDFGFATAYRDGTGLHLPGTLPGAQCVIIRKGPRSRSSVRRSGPPTARTWSGWPGRPAPLSGRCAALAAKRW
jgi:hypothetical protein